MHSPMPGRRPGELSSFLKAKMSLGSVPCHCHCRETMCYLRGACTFPVCRVAQAIHPPGEVARSSSTLGTTWRDSRQSGGALCIMRSVIEPPELPHCSSAMYVPSYP